MEIVIADSYEAMSRVAADKVRDCVLEKPDCVLGLATGSTPIGMYDCLIKDYEDGLISFKHVKSFNLDEYFGLNPEHVQSYRYFMNNHLFNSIDIDKANTHVPSGTSNDIDKECISYDVQIREAGGIDLQVLGIGHNGHIGFNEPCDFFPKGTHPVKLAESTISANSSLFDSIDDVPREAITMGIGTIMKAKSIVIMANGHGKAYIVKRAFFGDVTPEVPASILQFHPNVTVVVDREAAAKII
ncbi:MAG: glucosamine-6-phosphate deaminase [Bacteroidaceae bacterium]|nr:glucosamine-6-phosphate deaminase [Bacteroidaceae bacterium]